MKRVLEIVAIILLLGVLRIYMEIPNIHPIGAIALFGGAMLTNKKFSLFLTFAVLLLSDVILGFIDPINAAYLGSISMLFTYLGFLSMVLIGQYFIGKKRNIGRIFVGASMSTILFFVLSNLGSWIYDPMYAKTLEGAIAALVAGIPFIRFTAISVIGGTLFVFGLYNAYEYVAARILSNRTVSEISGNEDNK